MDQATLLQIGHAIAAANGHPAPDEWAQEFAAHFAALQPAAPAATPATA